MLALLALVAQPVFLATYFVGNGESGMYFAVSEDGFHFRELTQPNVPVLRPAVGKDRLMRDPCLTQGPDGTWHLVWTTGWWDRHIGIAHSKDLLHWSDQKRIPVMEHEPSALNAWAPEITYDPSFRRFLVYWSSTVSDRFTATARPDGDLGPNRQPLNHRAYFTTNARLPALRADAPAVGPGLQRHRRHAPAVGRGRCWREVAALCQGRNARPGDEEALAAGDRPLGSGAV